MHVEIVGAYWIRVDDATRRDALELKYPSVARVADRATPGVQHVNAETSAIALVEVLIRNAAALDVGLFGQSSHNELQPTDQVAYDEVYLSADGKEPIGSVEANSRSEYRIAFFLHFYDPSVPLLYPTGRTAAPMPQPLPERLSRLIHYTPVD